MTTFDIIVVGSCSADVTCVVDTFPAPGETKISKSSTTACGGKGINQCTQAARLGAKTALICKIGTDRAGKAIRDLCVAENIDQSGICQDKDTPTAIAYITIDSVGENSIVIVPGANHKLNIEDVEKNENIIKKSKILILQNEINEEVNKAALKIAKRHGILTLMNAAPSKSDFDPDIFSLSDIFVVNCFEASQITGREVTNKTEVIEAAKCILRKGCKSVIITMGCKGLLFLSPKEEIYIPARKVEVVDTTGAGDSFVGALALYFSRSPWTNLKEILTKASIIASLSVQKIGAQGGMPRLTELADEDY